MADKKREISRPLPKLEELDTQYFWEETKKSGFLIRFATNRMKSFSILGSTAQSVWEL